MRNLVKQKTNPGYAVVYKSHTSAVQAQTDGHVLAIWGGGLSDVVDMYANVSDARWAPASIESACRHALALSYGDLVAVDTRTPHDPALRALAVAALDDGVWRAVERLAKATSKARACGAVLPQRDSTRADVRAANRDRDRGNHPGYDAIAIGEACVDLRLVRRALTCLRVRSGALRASGGMDPLLLETQTGVALVMPYRR